MNENNPDVVTHGCKILARLLVSHGSAYTSKFAGKSGGFTITANRIKRFWSLPQLWVIALCILFGYDVANLDLQSKSSLSEMLDIFSKRKIVYPDAIILITSMLQTGLNEVIRNSNHTTPQLDGRGGSAAPELAPAADNLAEALHSKCMYLFHYPSILVC